MTNRLFSRLRRALVHEVKTVRGAIYRRLSSSREREASIVDQFHRLYFDARGYNMTWRNTFWMGHAVLKCPLDLWQYQEILHDLRPDLIIETGTAFGGSALYLAHTLDHIGHGRIMTIDIEHREGRPEHDRITYITGSSTDTDVIAPVLDAAAKAKSVMVILDSDHSRDHVLAELRTLGPLVTPGSYLIVEDTNLNGHPVEPNYGPGPMEALDDYLVENRQFQIDARWEKFFLSFNPRGFLRRTAWSILPAFDTMPTFLLEIL
jgi:cephalosporin hydroxylase